jgi:hypothetical protein
MMLRTVPQQEPIPAVPLVRTLILPPCQHARTYVGPSHLSRLWMHSTDASVGRRPHGDPRRCPDSCSRRIPSNIRLKHLKNP